MIAAVTPCTFKHQYLIAPDGTIKQLPVKIPGHKEIAGLEEK
jgi:hypothetical protein